MGNVGGGASSAQLTLPGLRARRVFGRPPICGGIPFLAHAAARATSGWSGCSLQRLWRIRSTAQPAAIAWRSIAETAASLGGDGEAYRQMIGPVVHDWGLLEATVLGPPRVPRHPLALAKFGMKALRPASSFAGRFDSERAPALMSGLAAHAMLPLERFPTGAVALIFAALAHTTGWPFPRGGAQRLADALAALLRSLGGEIVTGVRVKNIDDLPAARAVLCDLSPRPLLRDRRPPLSRLLPALACSATATAWGHSKWTGRSTRRSPGWIRRSHRAGTVHVGGTLAEVAASERDAWNGRTSERPFVLLAQPTLFDPTRAPAGQHTAWAYCHVPHASTTDMLPFIEAQIERFAPGFRDRILARHVTTPADLERRNPNLVGGDIGMGTMDWRQLLLRPTWRQYSTPAPDIFICSASTPPGVGVHGMCGYFAAQAALGATLA